MHIIRIIFFKHEETKWWTNNHCKWYFIQKKTPIIIFASLIGGVGT